MKTRQVLVEIICECGGKEWPTTVPSESFVFECPQCSALCCYCFGASDDPRCNACFEEPPDEPVEVLDEVCALRDEAREAARMVGYAPVAGEYQLHELANDLAAIASHMLAEHVRSLDPFTQRVLELAGGGR